MKHVRIAYAHCREGQIAYELLAETIENDKVIYGIRITYGNDEILIRGITPRILKAEALFAAMVRGVVTPVTARDIVEDWLAI